MTIDSGDVYLGLYDLQIDDPAPFIAALDNSTNGDSYWSINSTAPTSYSPRSEGTWLIRGQGGPVPGGSVVLDWGAPCNDLTTPDQDFGVYRGNIPDYAQYTSLACSTNRETRYLVEGTSPDSFFLVVPQTTPAEGSYGRDSTDAERSPAGVACKPQAIGTCP